jgi:hypothetical protein
VTCACLKYRTQISFFACQYYKYYLWYLNYFWRYSRWASLTESNRLATPNETDGCSYASTSLLAIVYVLCFFSETVNIINIICDIWIIFFKCAIDVFEISFNMQNDLTFSVTSWIGRNCCVRHVRISFAPTVTGTVQNLHQAKNTSWFRWKITRYYLVLLYL